MQIIGVAILFGIIWYGFRERADEAISAFDPHALIMVMGGSTAAILLSSSTRDALLTLFALGEFIPGVKRFHKGTDAIEQEREQVVSLWREGKRAAAAEVAQSSTFPVMTKMIELIVSRAPGPVTDAAFTELRHSETAYWQPIIHNWLMLSKLGPSFGMMGTITGMVQLFKNMSNSNLNIGAAMSLALLSTLYGVAFGSGLAGPIGHYLNNLLDERLGVLERCEGSVRELISRGDR